MPLQLKNLWQSVPNGFQYTQKETGWSLTTWDFNELCRAVQKHRQSNPKLGLSLDLSDIESEVNQVNAQRMMTIPGADIYVQNSGGSVSASALGKQIPQRLLDVAEKVAQLNAGRALISEWKSLGYDPVPKEESNRRAEICTDCPQNGKGDLTRWFTVPASERIRKEIESLKNENLTTEHDSKLGICEACLCPLRLKVHTPLPLIRKHLTDQSKAALDPRCWIL